MADFLELAFGLRTEVWRVQPEGEEGPKGTSVLGIENSVCKGPKREEVQQGTGNLKEFSLAGAQNAWKKWQEMVRQAGAGPGWTWSNMYELECISRGELLMDPDQRQRK